ncbi:hypothetical protein K9L16_03920 [Candidatus Pacearchaeota archaeon]|nr:hypothetical protein [Candidatus Pacearchaeota archaeon]
MKKTLSKTQAKKEIEDFFKNIKEKTPKEIKKIKRLAMAYNIALKEKRKLFCKKCLTPYSGKSDKGKTRIKNNKKIIKCENCSYIARWKIR